MASPEEISKPGSRMFASPLEGLAGSFHAIPADWRANPRGNFELT